MSKSPTYLVTGAGGGVAGISPQVVTRLRDRGETVRAMVHHDDARADTLRAQGADVVVGDLTNPADVFAAMSGVTRMFFNMSVSPDYLQATALACAMAKELDNLEVLVNMSQMTVSQMTVTSTEESNQQRLHWLAEHVINWSGIPAVHSGRPSYSRILSSRPWRPAPSGRPANYPSRSEQAALHPSRPATSPKS